MSRLANSPSIGTRPRLALGAIAAALLAGSAHAQPVELPPELLDAAREHARTITDGEEIGGSVSVLGVDGGRELDMLKAAWKPFEEATGVTVDYTGTTDFAAVLQTRVQAGDPPDLAASTNINNLVRYAGEGVLQDVGAMVGEDKFEGSFDPGLLSAATVDGKIYGVWDRVNNFMVWYNVHTYDGPKDDPTWQEFDAWAKGRAEAGSPPWCYADERGASSGAIGGNWIQSYLLKNHGPEKVRQLAEGELAWTSPEVRDAFEAFGAMASDPTMVPGGPIAALSTPAIRIGGGLFSDPPLCSVLLWGTYAGSLTQQMYPNVQPITDLDFMPVPGKPEFANYEAFGGTLYLAFKETPQVAAFLSYLVSPESQALVAATGNWTVANQKIEADDYPNPVMQKARAEMLGPEITLVATPTQVASRAVGQALWKGIVQYVQDPSSLDEVLSSLDAAAKLN
jgi:alpha-glucoside transport system substrate-binding protein